MWDLSGTLIPVNYPEKSVKGPILNIVIINLLFTTLYQFQINTVSNESNIKSIFFSILYYLVKVTYFCINWTNMAPLGPFAPIYILYRTHFDFCPPIAHLGPI